MTPRNQIQSAFLVTLATAIACSSEEPDSSVAALTEAGSMTPETGIAAGGGGGCVDTGAAGASGADSAAQDAAIPAVPPPECIPTCLWEVLSSCIDPGATAVAPDSGGCVRQGQVVCDACDGFYFSSQTSGVLGAIGWEGACYAGGQLVYTKRIERYGTSASFPRVFYEDPEGRVLVEVPDVFTYPYTPTIFCGGGDAAGAGEVMLLGEALDGSRVIPDHPCAPWVSLVTPPAIEYYWPGCTPGECSAPP